MAITSFAGIIRTHGRERPDHPALEYEGTTHTFGQLDAKSSQLATALASIGVQAEDRVAFLDKNGPEFFEVTFALAKLNAVNVAINWRLAPTEMAQIANDAQAKVLIVGAEFFPHVEKIEEDLETVTTIIAIGDHARWHDYERFIGAHPATDPGAEPVSSDVAIQLYTSGTTGLPKGVMLTNDN